MSAERLRRSRILITGGAGFLGVHAAQELAACGAQLLLQDSAYKRADLLESVLRLGRMAFVVCGLEALERAPGFSTLYGPGETQAPRLIPSFIRSLLAGQSPIVRGDGNDWWDYLYVRDAARAIRLALEHGAEAPGVYNVGAGHGWTPRAVAHALQRLMCLALPPKHLPGGAPRRALVADVSHARSQLHFSPETGLPDGLRAEVAYHRAQAAAVEAGHRPGRGRPRRPAAQAART